MKTVVISGYYGYDNIGDEALLASIIYALKKEINDLRIIVLSANPDKTSRCYGVEAVNRLSPGSVFSALKQADLLISGGGSLLQDVTGILTIPYYLGIVAMAKLLGKRVMFYAQGIGPVNRRFGRTLIRLAANRVDAITLRDEASEVLLEEIGVSRPPVEVTADPVFGMSEDSGEKCQEILRLMGIEALDGPYAGIFVREWNRQDGYKKAVADLADYLYSQGWKVLFVPMQYPADVEPAEEIAGIMESKPVIIRQGLDLRQLMGIVKRLDLVIAMRLHALIVSTICCVPAVGISYDPKVAEFLTATGQPVVKELETISSGELVRMVDELIGDRERVKERLCKIKEEYRKRAFRNSEIAVRLITQR